MSASPSPGSDAQLVDSGVEMKSHHIAVDSNASITSIDGGLSGSEGTTTADAPPGADDAPEDFKKEDFKKKDASVIACITESEVFRLLIKLMKQYWLWIFALFWTIYSIAAFAIDFERALPLFVLDMFVLVIIAWKVFVKYFGGMLRKIGNTITSLSNNKCITRVLAVIAVLAILGIVIWCCHEDWGRLTALLGLFVFISGCWLFSWHRSEIKWRPVIWGFGLQFIFGLLILRTQFGFETFEWLGNAFSTLLDFTLDGSGFVFGYLATGDVVDSSPWGGDDYVPVFAFSVLPTVIFFSSLVSVLYYLGVLQVIIYYISKLMQYTLGTSTSESLNAAGNIFVGMTEAPLLIRPFLPNMTRSELHAVMTGGFATIAGGVLAIYVSFGVQASHLLSASVMSAPAALAISKIVYPENEISPTAQNDKNSGDDDAEKVLEQISKGDETNVIEAAANGAMVALGLAGNIAGMLIAFLSLIAFLDYLFSYWGSLIGWDITFTSLCGYLFYPIAFLMGIEPSDCLTAGELIGTKVVVNEFVAYLDLTSDSVQDSISSRSNIVLIYALCGFSNLGSIGITLGGLTPLAPERTKDLTQLVVSAMISGNLACFMTACIAALLYDADRYD